MEPGPFDKLWNWYKNWYAPKKPSYEGDGVTPLREKARDPRPYYLQPGYQDDLRFMESWPAFVQQQLAKGLTVDQAKALYRQRHIEKWSKHQLGPGYGP